MAYVIDGGKIHFIKGSPEVILDKSQLNNKDIKSVIQEVDEWASKGFRNIALAYKISKEAEIATNGYTYLGFSAIIDPLREGVIEAVKIAQKAGIEVVMVTGNHPNTAFLSPRSLAPALKFANIGISMGKSGTDVARESSDLILTDDSFSSIINGIKEGRVAYDNIRKVIHLLISTGFAEIFLVVLSMLFFIPIPLLPVQILWLNLVSNGIQDVALGVEKAEPDVLSRKARDSKEPIFNKIMISRVLVGGFYMGVSIHVLCMYTPFMQKLLNIQPVSLKMWGLLLLLASTLIIVMELEKILRKYINLNINRKERLISLFH
ncbi:MAG: cation transporting ATPase C-terminal domain-containing protein [Sulfurospirillaceae bacterium]|nr:cation transporting ATPase C-terminal domain-containing protein [Sulfurospirillaceae bacterium]